ncbi:SDR family NAD(P)-dependent oxidoreductase [Oecophyllibacter saccharovorans]|uniref:SDR family NAD(P)-dependent oxidoreductase n=1 Tax=Oecophyllibacter saccharovorans TaxID=2558360 RepID=A0A506UL31_9PROT|nr:SDR family NAD(P)-dependent oxidoreductase [Oecophyllibacter saccharovorans]TPW34046.1 SDR family NAD(P)-dependent oxidoreductase [Oecophyllibacter saccharovorans]
MTVLVTGVAGFIGAALARALLAEGENVIGIDHLGAYPALAHARLQALLVSPDFAFHQFDLGGTQESYQQVERFMKRHPHIRDVVHLAGRGGVRQSCRIPERFVHDNIDAHTALLQACRHLPTLRHVFYASSSAVYGHGARLPYAEAAPLGRPGSFYAVTKRTNELAAETFAGLYGLSLTGLRFFTVYGPWGRPDMACWKFASALRRGEEVTLWQDQDLARDFTFIDDVVQGIIRLLHQPSVPGRARVLNLGKGRADRVEILAKQLADCLHKPLHLRRPPRPPEDLLQTEADLTSLEAACAWRPTTPLAEGISRFCTWFDGVEEAVLRVWEQP